MKAAPSSSIGTSKKAPHVMLILSPARALQRIVNEACVHHGFIVESFTHRREFNLRKENQDPSNPISKERIRIVVKMDGLYFWHYRTVYGYRMLVNELAIIEKKTLQEVLATLRILS